MFRYLFLSITCTIVFIGCGIDKNTSLSDLRQQAFEDSLLFNIKKKAILKTILKKWCLNM